MKLYLYKSLLKPKYLCEFKDGSTVIKYMDLDNNSEEITYVENCIIEIGVASNFSRALFPSYGYFVTIETKRKKLYGWILKFDYILKLTDYLDSVKKNEYNFGTVDNESFKFSIQQKRNMLQKTDLSSNGICYNDIRSISTTTSEKAKDSKLIIVIKTKKQELNIDILSQESGFKFLMDLITKSKKNLVNISNDILNFAAVFTLILTCILSIFSASLSILIFIVFVLVFWFYKNFVIDNKSRTIMALIKQPLLSKRYIMNMIIFLLINTLNLLIITINMNMVNILFFVATFGLMFFLFVMSLIYNYFFDKKILKE